MPKSLNKVDHLKFSMLICFASLIVLTASGCTNGGLSALISTNPTTGVSGVVSAGLINGATITAYALNVDGTKGAQLATATSDSSGRYTLNLSAQTGPVEIIATGGSYVEEASGSTVNMGNAQIRTLLPSTSATQQVAITPVTEIATQQAISAVSSNPSIPVASIIKTSNATVATAMGLTDITLPPANPGQSASAASTMQAAQYAVVLASISQMASTATTQAGTTVNSLDMMQALATSLTYNGNFNATLSGAVAVPVPTASGATLNLSTVLNAVGGSTDFSTAMQAAATTYKGSTAATNLGYNSVTAPTFVTAPSVPAGQVAVTPPTPPTTLPYLPPTTSGPPPVVGQAGTAAPTLSYIATTSDSGTIGYAMSVAPNIIMPNGAPITACAIKASTTALPTGLSINANTCVISGTPTGASSGQYTIVATNSVATSTGSLVTLTVAAPSPHIYISDTSFGYMACPLDTTTGLLQACAAHAGGNYYNSFDLDATVSGVVGHLFMGMGSGVVGCTANTATGTVTCPRAPTSAVQGGKAATVHTLSSGAQFVYTFDANSNIYVCPVTNGVPGSCTMTDSGLSVPIAGQGNSSGQWKPEGITFYTTTGDPTTGGTTYAYVLEDHLTGSIFKCTVTDPTTGVLSNCAAISTPGLGSVGGASKLTVQTVGSNTYMYMATYGTVMKCTLTPSTGALSACTTTTGTVTGWNAGFITFSSLGGSTLYAYVADDLNSKIYVCGLNTSTGAFSTCTPSAASGMAQPSGIAVF